MNFEISEMEYYPIPMITQISAYDATVIEGIKENEVYRTSICIKVSYFDNEFNVLEKDIILPFELNLGDKELIELKINKVDVQVIDNQGLNIEYNLYVEVSDVLEVENICLQEATVENIDIIENVEETKESISASYEEVVHSTGIREELPVNYVETEELPISNLKDDYTGVTVLFNINVEQIDKIAFKYNLSIDECYKKISSDKTRLII